MNGAQKILCLGAGGFIGSHLVERLLRGGHEVTGLDTHDDKLADVRTHPRFHWIHTDISDHAFDLDAVAAADLVIDLIAYANGLVHMPLEIFRLNFSENRHRRVLRAAR